MKTKFYLYFCVSIVAVLQIGGTWCLASLLLQNNKSLFVVLCGLQQSLLITLQICYDTFQTFFREMAVCGLVFYVLCQKGIVSSVFGTPSPSRIQNLDMIGVAINTFPSSIWCFLLNQDDTSEPHGSLYSNMSKRYLPAESDSVTLLREPRPCGLFGYGFQVEDHLCEFASCSVLLIT